MPQSLTPGKRFAQETEVDFVVIGSGPAGASVARELSRKGFEVLVLEQGRAVSQQEMEHDELGAFITGRWSNDAVTQPQTYRRTPQEKAEPSQYVGYAKVVGGTSFHYTANYWRFRPIDFHEYSAKGGVP
ncbi:MAG: FAD-dependent oxidoreductase, partial [Gemmatimonadales bacterium]|nr:FAD-dependent oxidoreductase [Gemmatimonadales bacterium]